MSKEIRFSRIGMKRLVKYIYQYVLSRMEDTEVDTTYLKKIHALVKEAEKYYLYDEDMGLASSSDLFECPVKVAKEFFGQINEYTIKQAWDTIPHGCVNCFGELSFCEYTGYTLFLFYLSGKCGYYNNLSKRTSMARLDVIILANLIQTLDLPQKVFLDCLDYMSCHFDALSCFDKYRLWEESKRSHKGDVCRCFCNQETDFNSSPEFKKEGI